MNLRLLPTAVVAALALGCAGSHLPQSTPASPAEPAGTIPHAQWQSKPPLGYAADAMRRNEPVGGAFTFHDLTVRVLDTSVDSSVTPAVRVARLQLRTGDALFTRAARAGEAFDWNGYHVAVVDIYAPGALGNGLTALEVATVASLPPAIASSSVAGGADMRLRIPQHITSITLHHEGSARPLLPGDDPVAQLRALQAWSASDRNWWDVPYHFLIDLDGHVYEGRVWLYMGETNTTYDPQGHLLITVIGNYNLQEPTQAELNSIADVMAWAVKKFDVPLDSIKGHYQYAETNCPGKNLRKYLEDGTFRRMVQARLK
jgi:hypothetical protein